MFNDLKFNSFLPGRMIFLYGTSSAGKTSLVEYIKSKAKSEGVDLVITGSDVVLNLITFHAYYCYSPNKIKFLRRYFTVEEILGSTYEGVYFSKLVSKLIKEKSISEEEGLIIQHILRELCVNTKNIMEKFFVSYDRNYFYLLSFLPALISGKTIIVDTVFPEGFFQALSTKLLHCKIDIVMVYCSPKKLIEHIYVRNVEALASPSLANCRPEAYPFMQYVGIYEPTAFPYEAIDDMEISNVQVPIELLEICKSIFERTGQLSQYQANQWLEAADLIQKSFGINTSKNKIFIKPRCNYHFLIDTGKDTVEHCGDRLLKVLLIIRK